MAESSSGVSRPKNRLQEQIKQEKLREHRRKTLRDFMFRTKETIERFFDKSLKFPDDKGQLEKLLEFIENIEEIVMRHPGFVELFKNESIKKISEKDLAKSLQTGNETSSTAQVNLEKNFQAIKEILGVRPNIKVLLKTIKPRVKKDISIIENVVSNQYSAKKFLKKTYPDEIRTEASKAKD